MIYNIGRRHDDARVACELCSKPRFDDGFDFRENTFA